MGDTGPCGRCSEIHYFRGADLPCSASVCLGPACDCDRFVEIWNNVFMEFDRQPDSLQPLPKPSIDTGMGLERIAAVMRGTLSNYDTDVFAPLLIAIDQAAGGSGHSPAELATSMAPPAVSTRVVADHLRAMTFLIGDGVLPSNEWRGYVLRKIMRRAMRHGRRLGLTEPFLHRLADVLVAQMGDAYPELRTGRDTIVQVIRAEEARFDAVLTGGLPRLEELLDTAAASGAVVSGEEAFRLYDTWGLPLDFIEDLAGERRLAFDREGFDRAMQTQREKARAKSAFDTRRAEGPQFADDAAAGALRAAGVDLPRFDEVAVGGRALLYTLATVVAVTLLCGLLPAVRTVGGLATLRGGAARAQVSTRNPLQWLLVGAQVALSVILLAGAGLLVRSFHELSRVDPGFDPKGVLTFRVSGSWGETTNYAGVMQRIDATIDALATLPGVEAAATSGWEVPGVPTQWLTTYELVEASTDSRPIVAEGRAVSAEYFGTMWIPVLAGELCRRAAPPAGSEPPVYEIMVNRAFVNRYLADRPSPIGLHLREVEGPSRRASRIVGVVGDARERGLDREPGPTVYWCMSAPSPMPYFVVRARGDLGAVAQSVRMLMKDIEPLRSVYEVAPLEERIGDAFKENRLRTLLLAVFAAAALSLTCVGLYGTLSYAISVRRREVGLRLALGAPRRGIVAHFLARAAWVVGPACVLGIALALASSRLLAGMLYGVSSTDPATFLGVAALVLAVATLAVLVPATRAALLEPTQVLREQ
jgi:hypothetical protein